MFATGAFEIIIYAWYFTTPVAQTTIRSAPFFFSRSLSLIITHISNEVIEYNTQYLWYGSNSYDLVQHIYSTLKESKDCPMFDFLYRMRKPNEMRVGIDRLSVWGRFASMCLIMHTILPSIRTPTDLLPTKHFVCNHHTTKIRDDITK